MKKVCVITGGGSGMGLATAKILGKENFIVIAGRTQAKLEEAVSELQNLGIDVRAVTCDVSDKGSVEHLAKTASSIGKIAAVIHAAGLSPGMGRAETIMKINAVGTVHMHNVFLEYMEAGSCLIDVASVGAYFVPNLLLPRRAYRFNNINLEHFMKKMLARTRIVPAQRRSGLAYGISKDFVIWYVKTDCTRFAKKGVRLLSVSPGSFDTEMGELEKEGAQQYLQYNAIQRFGKVEEIAQLLAFCTDKRLGYLTGVDILCDGGCWANYQQSPLSLLGLTHKQ